MTHVNPSGFVEPDSEIEWRIHRRLRGATEGSTFRNIEIKDRESITMAEQRRTLSDYEWPQFIGEEFGYSSTCSEC